MSNNNDQYLCKKQIVLTGLNLIILKHLSFFSVASAQVFEDGTVNTQVTSTNNQLVISGGTEKGNNLFHSFEQFSIPNNIEAYFNNSDNINNIISRVTGNSISNIEGIIRANGTANLLLINPNGITFGPNSQINIGGSFLATTAENITFADGVQFGAINAQPNSLLTMSVPVGLQFGSNPSPIRNQGNILGIKPGNTLALVGGDLIFSGSNLLVSDLQVELGSVGSHSNVQIRNNEAGFQVGYQTVKNFQDISLSQESQLVAFNSTFNLQGRHITLDQSIIVSVTQGSQVAGDINVNASKSVELIGLKNSEFTTGFLAQVEEGATGRGGNLLINTQKLIIQDGAGLSAGSRGEGQAGTLMINASELVELTGTGFFSPSLLTTSTDSLGDGGEIEINTKQLIIRDGGSIEAFTLGNGQGGTITINASELVQISGSGIIGATQTETSSQITTSSGLQDVGLGIAPGGNLSINTEQLKVTNGGIVNAGSLGSGNAGNVNIRANSIFLDNQGIITASSEGTGNAGNLTINTDQLTVNERSEVAVRSIGTGEGGNLTLNAQSISLDDKSRLTATSEALDPEIALELGLDPEVLELDNGLANAGSLNITTDNLRVNDDSEVTVSSFGLGNAGDINIRATDILLDNSSRLSAETASGEGGNISLDVAQFLTLRRGSTLSTTAGTTGGLGNGGNIDINALFIIAVPTENSDIIANAFLGRGGNINIDAAGVFGIEERERLTPLSDITASSQFGQVGNIGINRPDVDPQRSLVKLPDEVVDTNNVIVDACRPGGALTRGEFTITGRGGLPSNPNEGVDNPTGLTELGYPTNTDSSNFVPSEQNRSSPAPEVYTNQNETYTPTIVEAQGWIINADGNVVLTAQASTVTPHSPGLSPATCYDLSNRNSSP
ncbi:filamentous hemagglutinin N-terminal domain-containing protein [Crocosphaera subtropica]|nr:filamentous hemagglutinin N-terminal domain-containing protein [Crocosphaera subtropica]